MDYNPYYDNAFYPSRKQNTFVFTGKSLIQEQKEQILIQEEKRKQDKQEQVDKERKINQEEVVYLQKADRKNPNASQRKEILKQMDKQAEQNGDGGIFAKVFQQRDAKETLKQQQQEAYRNEIKQEIERKKKAREEEQRKKEEEDQKYEERIKQDLQFQYDKYNKEEEKKQQRVITTIKTKRQHQQQDQSKMLINEFEDSQLNITNNNIVPNYLKDPKIRETDDKFENELPQNARISQKSLDQQQQQQQYQQQQYQQQQQYYQQQQQFYNNSPYQQMNSQFYPQQLTQTIDNQIGQNQPSYNLSQFQPYMPTFQQQSQLPIVYNRQSLMPQLMENFYRDYEQIKYMNKMKNMEQEEDLARLKKQLEQQTQVWNEEYRRLQLGVQISEEGKNKAYYELESLKDQLRKQQIMEENNLQLTKQQLGYGTPQYPRYGGSREFGIPSRTENRIDEVSNSFNPVSD